MRERLVFLESWVEPRRGWRLWKLIWWRKEALMRQSKALMVFSTLHLRFWFPMITTFRQTSFFSFVLKSCIRTMKKITILLSNQQPNYFEKRYPFVIYFFHFVFYFYSLSLFFFLFSEFFLFLVTKLWDLIN